MSEEDEMGLTLIGKSVWDNCIVPKWATKQALIEDVCQVVQTRHHDGQDEADDGDDGGDGEDDGEHDQDLRAVLLPALLQAAHLLMSRRVPLLRHAGLSPPSRDISQH